LSASEIRDRRLSRSVVPACRFHDLPNTKAALEGHWFQPHFERLYAVCKSIAEDYGKWTDRSKFEALGDLADEIVREGGLTVSDFDSNGGFYVHVPFTPQTMPDVAKWSLRWIAKRRAGAEPLPIQPIKRMFDRPVELTA
jgi:hypothetical protein